MATDQHERIRSHLANFRPALLRDLQQELAAGFPSGEADMNYMFFLHDKARNKIVTEGLVEGDELDGLEFEWDEFRAMVDEAVAAIQDKPPLEEETEDEPPPALTKEKFFLLMGEAYDFAGWLRSEPDELEKVLEEAKEENGVDQLSLHSFFDLLLRKVETGERERLWGVLTRVFGLK